MHRRIIWITINPSSGAVLTDGFPPIHRLLEFLLDKRERQDRAPRFLDVLLLLVARRDTTVITWVIFSFL